MLRIFTISILLIFIITGCSQSQPTAIKTITVTKQTNADTLYLNGTIQPINIVTVIAPFDGAMTQKYFDYGGLLKKGQLLLAINSTQFNDNYQEALTNYLKAKRDYANNQSKMQGTEELKRLGIISRDEYNSDKSQIYDSSLALMQAQRKLQEILAKSNITIDFKQLDLSNSQTINKIIQTNIQQLKIYSPSNGIALLPVKTSDSDDASNKPLNIGDQIKAGQVLLTVGDISGIVLSVKVNEVHINDIQVGQQASISSNAFSETLRGQVTHVDQQATQDSGDSVPNFIVKN